MSMPEFLNSFNNKLIEDNLSLKNKSLPVKNKLSKFINTNDYKFNSVLTNDLNNNVLPHVLPSSSFNGEPSLFFNSYFEPQQFKVEQKNSTFFLMPTNLTSKISSMEQFIQFNDQTNQLSKLTNNLEKKIMNKELVDILNNLRKLTVQLEKKINGKLNHVDLTTKQDLLNQLDRMYKCLTNEDFGFEEESNLSSDLLQICNNNLKSSIINLNDNQLQFKNLKGLFLEDKLNLSSLDSPVNLCNQNTKKQLDEEEKNDEKELWNERQQINVGDQFIIDNRKNINQNRIKSSILGAVKKQKQLNNSVEQVINLNDSLKNSKRCVCPFCNQTFTQRNSLNRHIRGHTGEKPFPCDICGKSFSDKQRLLIHNRIHTGEKPFSCSICNREFSQKSTVKRHLTVHFKYYNGNNNDLNALNLKKKTKKVVRTNRNKFIKKTTNKNLSSENSSTNEKN